MNMEQLWNDIAIFEEGEVEAWKDTDPILQEARACARMEAYVNLMYKEIDNDIN